MINYCFPLCALGGPCEKANNEVLRSIMAEMGGASSELHPSTYTDQSKEEFNDSVIQGGFKNPTSR